MLQLTVALNIPPRVISREALLFSLWLHPHQDKDVGKDRDQGQSQGKNVAPRSDSSTLLPEHE